MDKPELLRLMRLLSGLEGVLMTNQQRAPDYLMDELSACVEVLEREILGAPKVDEHA